MSRNSACFRQIEENECGEKRDGDRYQKTLVQEEVAFGGGSVLVWELSGTADEVHCFRFRLKGQ